MRDSHMEKFLNDQIVLHEGDSREVIRSIESNSLDGSVTDPPYALTSILERFGDEDAAPVKVPDGADGAFARVSAGFQGQKWDTGETTFSVAFWREVFRVLKPGAHLVACGGSRSNHRMVCAIEDAGFEIRDGLAWLYGSGMAKSHSLALGYEKTLCERRGDKWFYIEDGAPLIRGQWRHPEAIAWTGWGTALKPAIEPICLARKPISESSIMANVRRWGVGALNIDACRIEAEDAEALARNWDRESINDIPGGNLIGSTGKLEQYASPSPLGRWPANVVHDGSPEVLAAFPETASGLKKNGGSRPRGDNDVFSRGQDGIASYGDEGSSSRFFYSAKADTDDRAGSGHPTVKPIGLKRWLARMIVPRGATIIEPFAGSGTTGEAAFYEGIRCIMIEREAAYCQDIRRRLGLVGSAGHSFRRIESARAKAERSKTAADHGPLFK